MFGNAFHCQATLQNVLSSSGLIARDAKEECYFHGSSRYTASLLSGIYAGSHFPLHKKSEWVLRNTTSAHLVSSSRNLRSCLSTGCSTLTSQSAAEIQCRNNRLRIGLSSEMISTPSTNGTLIFLLPLYHVYSF